MKQLRSGLKNMVEEKNGSAFILEGLAGMGKSAIVWQLQRESIDQNVRYLMGTGSAIEKQTPYFAFSQILCAAANLSSSPSYGEVLALKFTYQLDEDDINALGIMLPTLAKRNEDGTQVDHGRLEGRAAKVILKIFQAMENTVFVFEDAHWIDSQSWIMLQMVLPQLSGTSMVMIVTRPPNLESQLKGGGQAGTEGFTQTSEGQVEEEFLEDDDRVKFSRILAALKETSSITYLELGTMDIEAMRELIAKTLDVKTSAVTDDFVKLMDQKAGGIPMYLSSMTNWLKERSLVKKDNDGNIFFNGNVKDIKFPNSIMDTVMERVDSLDDEAKVLVKICSCFGFEFRQESLENVAGNFLSSKDPAHLESILETLAARSLVVPVTGESVSKMMKFTHQIITESAYGLMLDTQKRKVHKAIANEYENASFKFELDVLAYHWLRSGDVGRGCELLQNAAEKAFSMGAFKEAINSLGQAISYGKEHKNYPYWVAFLGYVRRSCGDIKSGYRILYRAMRLFDKDENFKPQVRSQLALDKLKRQYGELADVPEDQGKTCSELDRAKMLIALNMGDVLFNEVNIQDFRNAMMEDYKFNEEDLQYISEWYMHYGLLAAFKYNEIDLWTFYQSKWPVRNSTYLAQNEPEVCTRLYRRIIILGKNKRVSPQIRLYALGQTYLWYPSISPECIPKNNEMSEEMLLLNEGNIKYAYEQVLGIGHVIGGLVSMGNFKLADVFLQRMFKIRLDSEALEDNKASCYQFTQFIAIYLAFALNDSQKLRDAFSKLHSMGKLFPNTSSTFPVAGLQWLSKRMMACIAIQENDFENAESLMLGQITNGMEKYLIFSTNPHQVTFLVMTVYSILKLFEHKVEIGEDAPACKNALETMRDKLEAFEKILPGAHRCGGMALVGQISFALKDRPFAEELKKMEKALEYAIELECLPVDILLLEIEIAAWKGNVKQMRVIFAKCESLSYNYVVVQNKTKLEQLESGERKPVDLTFIPEIVEPILSDDEMLAKLKEDLVEAKKEVKLVGKSGTKEQVTAARATAKAIKLKLKQLEKDIAEKNKPTVDQAKIDELNAKIADAQSRQEQAFDDDDDEAEEAAALEIEKLREELDALEAVGASIPKQKLEDAKKTDAEINK
eukprot:g6235.t1